jgi:hypothetical protein
MFIWGSVAEWASFVGEIVVAAAIVWELDETRRFNFLSEVSSPEMYEARGEIYKAFINADGKSIAEKSEAIRKRIWSEPEFKKSCDGQILLFEKVGTLARYALFDRLFQGNQFVSVFPHAVIAFWIMLQGYMKDREERTGPWWAQNFRRLTVGCIEYILKQKKPRVRIHAASRAQTEDLIINERELRQLRSQLRAAQPDLSAE